MAKLSHAIPTAAKSIFVVLAKCFTEIGTHGQHDGSGELDMLRRYGLPWPLKHSDSMNENIPSMLSEAWFLLDFYDYGD